MLVVRRPRTGAAASRPLHACGSGSEVSLRQLLEHRLVQLGLRQQLLQPGVLALELLEPLGVIGLHAAVLGEPPRPGRLGDLELAAHLLGIHAPGQELLAFGELADDLLGRMPSSRHLWVLSCHRHDDGGDRTAQLLDHYEGLIPLPSPTCTEASAVVSTTDGSGPRAGTMVDGRSVPALAGATSVVVHRRPIGGGSSRRSDPHWSAWRAAAPRRTAWPGRIRARRVSRRSRAGPLDGDDSPGASRSTNPMAITLAFTVTVAGDSLTGTLSRGEQGGATISGTRA